MNMEVNWYALCGVALTIGLAYIAYLRDRMKVTSRVEELERMCATSKEDAALLDMSFNSDVDKIMMLATAAQEAARMQGKDLRVRDFAMILRHRQQSKKAKTTNQTGASGERTGERPPPPATAI